MHQRPQSRRQHRDVDVGAHHQLHVGEGLFPKRQVDLGGDRPPGAGAHVPEHAHHHVVGLVVHRCASGLDVLAHP